MQPSSEGSEISPTAIEYSEAKTSITAALDSNIYDVSESTNMIKIQQAEGGHSKCGDWERIFK